MSYSPWLLHCRVLYVAYYRCSSLLEGMNILVTNEYPLDVSLPCECIYVLVERCFPELQSFVYLSEWVRKGQLEWEDLAEEGKLEPGSKRQQVTGVTVSLAPTLHSVGFQNWAQCFPFLLALFKFSHTVRHSYLETAAAAAKSLQSCLTLWDPRDGSPPAPPVPGILQARTLEWVAISFSSAWKCKVKVKSLSRVRLSYPMDCAQGCFFPFVEEDEELVSCFQQICFPSSF